MREGAFHFQHFRIVSAHPKFDNGARSLFSQKQVDQSSSEAEVDLKEDERL